MEDAMTSSRQIPCPKCSKKFRTTSGLRWHLYHRHGWQNVEDLLDEPSNLAKAAMLKEIELEVLAKGAGVEVGYLKHLIEKHFGKDVFSAS
jgi:hypothetical protein